MPDTPVIVVSDSIDAGCCIAADGIVLVSPLDPPAVREQIARTALEQISAAA